MLRDAEFGPVRLRAFGSYCARISDPGQFIRQIAGTTSVFETEGIVDQFRNILASRFADALGEAGIPILDLAANYNEIGEQLRANLQSEFDEYGVTLTKFLIENISLPEEVERALDKRSQMGILGNMNTYMQFQTANSVQDMANNPGGSGNMMGVIAGLGMGQAVGGAMQNAAQAPQQPGVAPPPMPQPVQWYAAVGGQQVGPLTPEALQQQIQGGSVQAGTLVWRQGMPNWAPANQVPELAGMFSAGGPPPLPGQP
jgi:membrane protease subunit (stomatin/prohibitin family)